MNDQELRFVDAFDQMAQIANRVAIVKGWNGVPCGVCDGKGWLDGADAREWCEECSGSGWTKKPPSFLERLALVHSEVSEALEAYRRKGDDDHSKALGELADAVIRLMGMFDGKLTCELAVAIVTKINVNQSRDWAAEGKSI